MGAGNPWREMHCEEKPWTTSHLGELLTAIPKISYERDDRDVTGSIAVVGQTQAGKSSFIKSVLSVGNSVTQTPEGELQKFYCGNFLVSEMGLELEHKDINFEDIKYMAKGNIPLDRQKSTSPHSVGFVEKPGYKDGIHCFVFVVDASAKVPGEIIQKIRKIQTVLAEIAGGIPRILILTKIDKLDKDVNDDIGKTFRNSKVEQAVKTASEKYYIPEKYIYPVKNFTNKQIPETKAKILILMALKKALEFAEDQVEKLDKKSMHEMR